ncbi:hypothetical protein H6F90_10370 [Trichocoleus sp. FACHB-591]|uniref:DUF6734 family protein n=1 Tax=Trichocoleus sp. FACHB-591 TaxID=2692872 RepID=UPI0016880417|nr:DUF6734 family protein [Trichocoleus sp. FACHB-591]MBD2095561.1 hypothetical protein [Trichocoleus sp. FACHB-591]
MSQAIARSVWSFWTKPFRSHRQTIWFSEKHHLLAWILSLETTRKHYPETALVTDDAGAKMLIDGLGLEFDSVTTELNALQAQDPDWWILGKLWAYRSQTQPFIHVDNDVFLWKPLPPVVNTAPVLAQNPEYFVFGKPLATCWWYRPEIFNHRVKSTNGWLPDEWNWYFAKRRNLAYCCGIMGGAQVDFIRHYADMALRIAADPGNQAALALMDNKLGDCLLIEQYFLAACIEYHQQLPDSLFADVSIECLFDSPEAAFSSQQPDQLGYTHLIGEAKRDAAIARRLEKRVAEEYPNQYQRCLRYLEKVEFFLGSDRTYSPVAAQTEDLLEVSDSNTELGSSLNSAASPLTHPTPTDLNRVIYASWHHDQVLTRNAFLELVQTVGLVIQFAKPVRVDSLHQRSVLLWSHGGDTIANQQLIHQPKIQPVRITALMNQRTYWRVGETDIGNEFQLVSGIEALENVLFTDAVQLTWPEVQQFIKAGELDQLTVELRGDWILNEEVLFNIDLELQMELERGTISPKLRECFSNNGIPLSGSVAIASEVTGLCWRLVAQDKLYVIRKDTGQLSVRRLCALDGNHIWPGVPERHSGNGCEGGDWLSVIHLQ